MNGKQVGELGKKNLGATSCRSYSSPRQPSPPRNQKGDPCAFLAPLESQGAKSPPGLQFKFKKHVLKITS